MNLTEMELSDIPKVSEFFPIVNGVVSHMNYDFIIITKQELDILFTTQYGMRSISPVASQLAEISPPTDSELTTIAGLTENLFKSKWDKLLNLYQTDYDPLHNYKDELVETIDGSGTESTDTASTTTDTLKTHEAINSTRTDNLSEDITSTSTGSGSGKDDSSLYGFNSSNASNSDSSQSTSESETQGTSTKANTGRVDDDKNIAFESNDTITNESNIGRNTSSKKERTATHTGNIGNLTTQQMYTQEIEIRKWNFINQVLDDLKEFLTIPLYI